MADSFRAPFEDGPPTSAAPGSAAAPDAVRPAPAGAAGITGQVPGLRAGSGGKRGGPAPGSAEEAEIILRALALGAKSPGRSTRAKTGLIVAVVIIVAITVVGLILAADHFQNLSGSNSPPPGAGAAALTTSEANLNSALQAAQAYEHGHGGRLAGLSAGALGHAAPSLSFSGVSGGSGQVGVATPTTTSLVITSLQASPAACFGLLQVLSAQAVPIFSTYSVTVRPGLYYFEAPTSGGLCDALTVQPPAGGAYLSSSGFPTQSLP